MTSLDNILPVGRAIMVRPYVWLLSYMLLMMIMIRRMMDVLLLVLL